MNTEIAYKNIVQRGIESVIDENWDSIVIRCGVFEKMVSYEINAKFLETLKPAMGECSLNTSRSATGAVLFLRDNLMETTGQRIWGLTFTYHNNGKFNIEYDYNKPEGFDD